MIARLILTALLAGLTGGLVVSAVQALRVTPLILQAETYETAAPAPPHAHAADAPAHTHDAAAWAPADGVERTLFTVLANVIAGVGFAALLAAGFVLAGRSPATGEALLWGAAGFLAFSFLPAIGLPPELPGSAAAGLGARQGWWLAAVIANCAGLALIAFGPRAGWKALGALAILAPLAVGAPHPPGGARGLVPPELAAQFVTASLATALVFWLTLGAAAACVWRRLGRAAGAGQAARA